MEAACLGTLWCFTMARPIVFQQGADLQLDGAGLFGDALDMLVRFGARSRCNWDCAWAIRA